jgi:ABC-type cobalamin/Fe3+-siderophores transport system ATPase subunit
MNTNVIDIQQAVVSHRDNIALKGVTLKVESGEFVGIIGPNGAGKSTLLTVVNGLGKLRSGSVRVLGNSLDNRGGNSLRKRIGYVSQLENIDRRMPMSVREVVMIGRYGVLGPFRNPGKHDWEIVDGALDLTGMTRLADRPIGQLSGGEQQRASIARCLAQEPELFLLDEPTASLDWRAQTEILGLVKQIHDSRNLTTLFVTHDMNTLPITCDRVVLMKNGLIFGEGRPEKLLTDENLSRLYDIPLTAMKERHKEAMEYVSATLRHALGQRKV